VAAPAAVPSFKPAETSSPRARAAAKPATIESPEPTVLRRSTTGGRSTVGSGDSMVAGLAVALARGDDVEAALKLGTAAGAATAASTGTGLGTAEAVEALLPRVEIEALA